MEAANNSPFNEEKVQKVVLTTLNETGSIEDTLVLAQKLEITHVDLDKVLKSLIVDEYIVLQVIERKIIELSDEGKGYVEKGTPEF